VQPTRDPEKGTEAPAPRLVQSVSRAAQLLKHLASEGAPMKLTELARAVGLSKPATFHLLRTLELEGFVRKTAAATYQLDWGLYELGSAVIRTVDLTRVARLHLDHLAEVTGEAVLLSILDGDSVLYLDRGQAVESFAMTANVGRRSPLHTNASGKTLLAHQPPEFIADFLGRDLTAKTQATICDPRELDQILESIRLDGFSTCWEEQEMGLCSVAVPLRDYTGKVCAAMTIAGPTQRVNHESVPRLAALLQAEAEKVSQALGYSAGTLVP